MITLYTSIGTYRLERDGLPVVVTGSRDCGLCPHELLLWSSLAVGRRIEGEANSELFF